MKIIESNITNIFEFYKNLRKDYKYTTLLETLGTPNASHEEALSIIGVVSEEILSGTYNAVFLSKIANGIEVEKHSVDWLNILDEWIKLMESDSSAYQLGCIGYVGYEMKHSFENFSEINISDTYIPDIFLVKYGLMLFYNHATQKAKWVFEDEKYIQEIKKLESKFLAPVSYEKFLILGDIDCNTTKLNYINNIEKILEHIKSGDVFQINYTIRFHAKYSGDPISLYTLLRDTTPNPYFAFLDFPNIVISTSPEKFFQIASSKITSSPIKGTMSLSKNGLDQKENLAKSEKNRSENIMIVDLIRNDLGKVCKHKTVKVTELCEVYKFNQIYHMQSKVEGVLRDDIKISDVLKSVFPCGSITGAPKIKAIEIIEDIENTKRQVYCGGIGFFGKLGWANFSVAIRVIYFSKDDVYFHSGGGIVIDSYAEDEYQEVLVKADKLSNTLNNFNVLNRVRDKIDKIDDKIFELFLERFEIIHEVSKIKELYAIPALQNNRVERMVSRMTEKVKEKNSEIDAENFVKDILNVLIKYSMSIENIKLKDKK